MLLSACAPAQVPVLPTQTNIVFAEVTITLEPNITPTQTTANIPTAILELSCPKINPDIQLNLPDEPDEIEASILNYLNEGGDPAKIESVASALDMPPFLLHLPILITIYYQKLL